MISDSLSGAQSNASLGVNSTSSSTGISFQFFVSCRVGSGVILRLSIDIIKPWAFLPAKTYTYVFSSARKKQLLWDILPSFKNGKSSH